MSNKKVRVNCEYYFDPVPMDRFHDCTVSEMKVIKGDLVRVVNQHGCPPANTMGMCYIEKNGKFAGMVCCNSLVSKKDWNKQSESQGEEIKKDGDFLKSHIFVVGIAR